MNESDSQRLANKLKKQGHRPVASAQQADLFIINVCSVRQSAIHRVNAQIRAMREKSRKTKIILTGCILAADKKRYAKIADDIWPITDFKCSPHAKEKQIAYLPIMTGCNNYCSYCAVPHTRGREKSRPVPTIIAEAKKLISQGCAELILLGQNVNSYSGRSLAPTGAKLLLNFPKLLAKIDSLPGNFILRFLTSHPKDMSDELIKTIANSKKISREIHLPVQSGDNLILKKMNRRYTVGHYKKLIKKIRNQIPGARFSTDIIVGFPTETNQQFQNTVKLVKEIGFFQIYAAAYSPRTGTSAAKLPDNVPGDIKKKRKKVILGLIKYE